MNRRVARLALSASVLVACQHQQQVTAFGIAVPLRSNELFDDTCKPPRQRPTATAMAAFRTVPRQYYESPSSSDDSYYEPEIISEGVTRIDVEQQQQHLRRHLATSLSAMSTGMMSMDFHRCKIMMMKGRRSYSPRHATVVEPPPTTTSSSGSRATTTTTFDDIPFKSNDMYARQFVDPRDEEMMQRRQYYESGGHRHFDYQNDFPSMMDPMYPSQYPMMPEYYTRPYEDEWQDAWGGGGCPPPAQCGGPTDENMMMGPLQPFFEYEEAYYNDHMMPPPPHPFHHDHHHHYYYPPVDPQHQQGMMGNMMPPPEPFVGGEGGEPFWGL
eukprot:scaffold8714_cov88-Cylindrotheca_fusiformis.AAC.1